MGCEIVRVYKDHGISGTRGPSITGREARSRRRLGKVMPLA
jgi:hypothetical protein